MTCERCGQLLQVGEWPFCPHGPASPAVIGDEIDWVIENNGTGEPIRFRSREALRLHLDAHNLMPMVRHVTRPGTDKSEHTVDWSKGSIDAVTLENARILTERQAQRGNEPPPPRIPIEVTVRTLDTGFVVRMERD